MNDDTLKALWDERVQDVPALPDPAALERIRRDAANLDRTVFWRDIRENLASLIVVLIFSYYYYHETGTLVRLGCAIVIVACIFSGIYSHLKKGRITPAAPDAPLSETLNVEVQKVDAQITLLQSIFWWYLLPLGVGTILVIIGVSSSTSHRLLSVMLCTAIYISIYWLNRRAVDRALLPMKQQLLAAITTDLPTTPLRVRMTAPVSTIVTTSIVLLGILAYIFAAEKGTSASLPAGTAAQDAASQSLEATRMKYKFPAMAAAIVKEGTLVEAKAVGFRKAGGTEPVSNDDKFHIGSITKSMTATLAAMLVEQNRISWDSTIGDLFPELKQELNAQYSSVTLEQLLSHRGGAPGNAPTDLWRKAWHAEGTPAQQRMEFVRGLLSRAPETPPGTKHVYSNQGYAIAGVMLEKASGQTWEQMMQSMLFDPLGMSSAGFGAPATVGKVDQPWGHEPGLLGNTPVPPGDRADNPLAISPANAVHCSISDLAKYAAFHLTGDRGEGKLLKPDSFMKLHTAVSGDYALGWTILKRGWAGGTALWHNGSNTMFYALVWIAPQRNCAVLAATNVGGDKAFSACDEAVTELLKRHSMLKK